MVQGLLDLRHRTTWLNKTTLVSVKPDSYLETGRRGPLRPATFSGCGLCRYCCSANSRRSSLRLPSSSHKSDSVAFKPSSVVQITGNWKNENWVDRVYLRSVTTRAASTLTFNPERRNSHANLCDSVKKKVLSSTVRPLLPASAFPLAAHHPWLFSFQGQWESGKRSSRETTPPSPSPFN